MYISPFDWAWRVRGPGLFEPITGACAGSRRRACDLARNTAHRIKQLGKPCGDYSTWKRTRSMAAAMFMLIACGGDPYTPPAQPSIEVVAL